MYKTVSDSGMKYKIVTNGIKYRVYCKNFFLWHSLFEVNNGWTNDFQYYEFNSEEAAEAAVKIILGTGARRVRTWRTAWNPKYIVRIVKIMNVNAGSFG